INIYPSAIEGVLLAEPSVAAFAAFGIDSLGHGSIPVAAVVLAGETTREELLAKAKAKLGMHAPLDIMIVGEFPTTTAGKVIKRELADAWRAANGPGL
ncbi:MAG: acyl--CoA ligase, partial [Rhodospirillales bacterium]|nr:acyl--CoA ligase [Rhodospirillales bacterium]